MPTKKREPTILEIADAYMLDLCGFDPDRLEFWLDRIVWRDAQRRDAPGVAADDGPCFVAAP